MIIYGEPSIGLLITIVIVVSIFIGVGIKNWLEDRKDKVRIELANTCDETQELLDKQIEATYKVVEENKELKDDNKVMADNYSKMEQKFYNKLNEAKDIIGNLYAICKDNNYPSSSVLMEQAEKFLKED